MSFARAAYSALVYALLPVALARLALRARREPRCGQCWWSAVQARRRRAICRTTPAASCPTPRSTPEAKRVNPGWPTK